MTAKNLIIAGVAGTTLMTAFSRLVSYKQKKNHNEAELLGSLLQGRNPEATDLSAKIAGWTLHYITGIAFTTTYAFALQLVEKEPSLVKGLVFGVLSGGISIVIWKILFLLDKKIAKLKDDEYFLQLFIAHIVFAVVASQTYKWLQKGPTRSKTETFYQT
jgi:hypothetical protein